MYRSLALAIAFTVLALCPEPSPVAAQAGAGGVIHRDSVPAPALRRHLVGEPPWGRVSIYLPPTSPRAPGAGAQTQHGRGPALGPRIDLSAAKLFPRSGETLSGCLLSSRLRCRR